jgi:isochorismate synthase
MNKHPFAIFRLPYADECTVVVQESASAESYADIAELRGKCGFVMIPFAQGGSKRISLIRPDRTSVCPVGEIESLQVDFFDGMEETAVGGKVSYAEAFGLFHSALCEGRFEKLVLSRCRRQEFGGGLLSAFKRACAAYPRMMVYMCSAPECGTWIGCTPEILLSGSRTHYRTVALAGTVPLSQAADGHEWSGKNRKEQQIVADYVRRTLEGLSSVVEEEGPYTSRAGELLHLKTHFHFSPNPGVSVADMVDSLHPTPAVCGMPKSESRDFIGENEGYERSYYSGVVGMLAPDGKTDLYVNLRCAQIVGTDAVLYAGGGLLASSDMESEWQETEAKMKTISNIL